MLCCGYLCWSPRCTQHWKNTLTNDKQQHKEQFFTLFYQTQIVVTQTHGTAISHQAHTYTRSLDATNARERVSIAHVNVGALVQAAREGIQQGGLARPGGAQQQCEPAGVQDAAHCV